MIKHIHQCDNPNCKAEKAMALANSLIARIERGDLGEAEAKPEAVAETALRELSGNPG